MIKQRLDLSPNLRELDEDIEKVELDFRKAIIEGCESDIGLIPQHIKQKVDERIKRASQKNAAFEMDRYKALDGILEFFDLREIQDLFVSKSLWNRFQNKFSNKETLTQKFNQLAEIRNSIRHSRSVDEIVQKEGEAAIIWFNKVLAIK